MAKRAYKYRFYPTEDQKVLLAKTFGCVRFVYNRVLEWRTNSYKENQERIGYIQANAQLSRIKADTALTWLGDVSSVPLQQSLRHQQMAFKNFYEGTARYPRFRSKCGKQSAEFTRSAFKFREGKIFIAKSKEPLDIRWSRPLPSEPSTISISMDSAGRYFISCRCEFVPIALPASGNAAGIDLGIDSIIVSDDGNKSGNPRHIRKYALKLARAQRALSRKAKGSSNRNRARAKVARIHAKIADCRTDFLHQLSRKLINENQVICVESLAVKNMVRNRSLSKAISDAGWGELVRQLEYKAAWAGRQLVKVDRWLPSSKKCSYCGHILDSIPLKVRAWTCPACGNGHDRDVNAARNIKAAGLAVLACGETVSPTAKVA